MSGDMSTTFTSEPWDWDDAPWEEYDPKERAPWLVDKVGNPILRGRINCSSEAYARLIAAAPDLYEALKELIDMDVAYQRGQKVSDAVDKARAALAKAEGKS